ncbi:hypothetical protein AK830_g5140 [Neonectria ditissima]|uniref:Sulfatase N-terminal domain-containing protein n=1 Tax=Neonectria ditissima TaxID=78410 RepID=A0A0P7B645_9HYPO|nr:hypothetical protein AK830_g5140 [Neonectria ditissima]
MIPNRRCLGGVFARCANRRFLLAIAAVSILSAKAAHIYAHLAALSTASVFRWGLSFFAQDVLLLLVLRLLADKDAFALVPWVRVVALVLTSVVVVFVLALASCNISFFIVAGSELHWRNIGFAGDASSLKLLLTGLASCLLVCFAILLASYVVQDIYYGATNLALDILKWPFVYLWNKAPKPRQLLSKVGYAHLPQQDVENSSEAEYELKEVESNERDSPIKLLASKPRVAAYSLVSVLLLALILETITRYEDTAFTFMSWTLPLIPFVDFANASPNLASMLPVYGSSINYSWDNLTALDEPIALSWLPKDTTLPGFEDWYEEDKTHYSGAADPMRISNLDSELLPGLRDKLGDVKIRHVVVVKLEGTRKDVFPVKKDSYIWEQLANTFEDKLLPQEAQDKLAHLVPTANFLTGDYDDGFDHPEFMRRGGINFKNAHTTASFTLKSLTGTLCGLSPLVADWNVEVFNHIYQPCLPQIFEAMNQMDRGNDTEPSSPWRSTFLQSVTGRFDKQEMLMPLLGFPADNTVMMEYLTGESPKFGHVDLPEGAPGLPEFILEDYLRDAFRSAKDKNERVFLAHLTGMSHHPFKLPPDEETVQLSGGNDPNVLSKYLNTIGYVDRWLARMMVVLEEEGVAEETLVVFVGDHGLCVAEHGCVTPYYAPHVANFHVPLVLSHPKLPQIDVEDAVTSHQILPTILDLLLETGSLSESESQAARDLVSNYEGQSLLRPMKDFSESTEQPNWQFSIMNPGRAMLSVRDAHQPNWRVVVPIVENIEWRFTDLAQDPHEENAVVGFGYKSFLDKVEIGRGREAAEWVEKAAFMSRWWVEENRKRWRYEEQQ